MKPSHLLACWSFQIFQPSGLARKDLPSLNSWQNWGTEKWLDLSMCSKASLEPGSSEPSLGNCKANFLGVSLIQVRAGSKSVYSWRGGGGLDKTPPAWQREPGPQVPKEVTDARTSRRGVGRWVRRWLIWEAEVLIGAASPDFTQFKSENLENQVLGRSLEGNN